MRPADYTYKAGDTKPDLRMQCLDGTGQPIDLTGASVEFHLSDTGWWGASGALVINAAAVVEAGVNGWVHYTFAVDQTSSFEGMMQAEFQVTYVGGAVETFPNGRNLSVYFTPDLGD